MRKSELLRAIQQEIRRHDFSNFVDNPPSAPQRGKGVVVPGHIFCKLCEMELHGFHPMSS
jgi:hypothetical protein